MTNAQRTKMIQTADRWVATARKHIATCRAALSEAERSNAEAEAQRMAILEIVDRDVASDEVSY